MVRNSCFFGAQAREGLDSVTLANGILMSHSTGKPVDVPIDREAYEKLLLGLIENPDFRKGEASGSGPAKMDESF